ncbi:uncharacterized protein LOC135813101 [Sycon ciliatum]|uniref:uncharacterized protein LOC135813101 n=1 Tax=Sycon ciliatum TaxID=27933 RepID=UPI0031F68C1C
MLVIFARIPVGQLRKLKCLHESEIDEIQGLYTEANSSIWLGWTCSGNTSSDDDDARSQSPIPTVDSVAAETVGARARDAVLHGLPSPDCVITTHSTPTVIRRCAVTECSPDVAALHSLLDRLHSVINVSSCLQALWFLGKKDLNAMRRSALLYGAILRLTLGLRAALSIVGVDTHDDYSNARVWADVIRCKYVTVASDTDIHYWTAFQPTLLWSGPLAINNVSMDNVSMDNVSMDNVSMDL